MPKQSKSTSTESTDAEAVLRTRAYHLWEADGRPDGRAEHYWHLATAEAAPARPKRKAAAKAVDAAVQKPRKKAKA